MELPTSCTGSPFTFCVSNFNWLTFFFLQFLESTAFSLLNCFKRDIVDSYELLKFNETLDNFNCYFSISVTFIVVLPLPWAYIPSKLFTMCGQQPWKASGVRIRSCTLREALVKGSNSSKHWFPAAFKSDLGAPTMKENEIITSGCLWVFCMLRRGLSR